MIHDTGSWIIVRRATSEAVCEVFDARSAERLRPEFVAVPAMDYLGDLNRRIREAGGVQPTPRPWLGQQRS